MLYGAYKTPEEEAAEAAAAAAAAAPVEEVVVQPAPVVSHAENLPSPSHIQSAQLADPTAYTGGTAPATATAAPVPVPAPAPQPITMPDGSTYRGKEQEYHLPPQTPQGAAEHPDAYDGGSGRGTLNIPQWAPDLSFGGRITGGGPSPSSATATISEWNPLGSQRPPLTSNPMAISPAGAGSTRLLSPNLPFTDPRSLDRRNWENTRNILDTQRSAAAPAAPSTGLPPLPFGQTTLEQVARAPRGTPIGAGDALGRGDARVTGSMLPPAPRSISSGDPAVTSLPRFVSPGYAASQSGGGTIRQEGRGTLNIPQWTPSIGAGSQASMAGPGFGGGLPKAEESAGPGFDFNFFKDALPSAEESASPGFDPSGTGMPTADWMSPFRTHVAERSNPEVEAGSKAADRSTVYLPGAVDRWAGGWFSERTSDKGREENRQNIASMAENLPGPGSAIHFRSDGPLGSFKPRLGNASASRPSSSQSKPPALAGNVNASPTSRENVTRSLPALSLQGQTGRANERSVDAQASLKNLEQNGSMVNGVINPVILDRMVSNGLIKDGQWTEKARNLAGTDMDTAVFMAHARLSPAAEDTSSLPLPPSSPALPSLPNTGTGVTPNEAASISGNSSDTSWGTWARRSGSGSGGGSGYGGGRGSRRTSSGGSDYDDTGWEDFLKDFDRDGDTDADDEKRARSLAAKKNSNRSKRGRRGKGSRASDRPIGSSHSTSPIRQHILAELTANLGRPIGGWPEGR